MIEIKDLCHSFGDKQVLKDVNVSLESGKILGLVGINGAGKSTFLRLISGVYEIQSGSVLYDGNKPSLAKTREDIFLLPDDPYFTKQTNTKTLFNLYATMYPNIDKQVYEDILERFNLPRKKSLKNFSKGMRRQTYIALAFAVAPKYLLLDEAFDGLDPLARKFFKEKIRELVEKKDTTVIISSHSLRELEDFCDEYTMIDEMHVVNSGAMLERATSYCKFQMAFKDEPTEDMFKFDDMPVKSIKIVKHFVTVVLEADSDAALEKLLSLSPLVVDKLDVNFEEAFIGDIDKRIRGGES